MRDVAQVSISHDELQILYKLIVILRHKNLGLQRHCLDSMTKSLTSSLELRLYIESKSAPTVPDRPINVTPRLPSLVRKGDERLAQWLRLAESGLLFCSSEDCEFDPLCSLAPECPFCIVYQ